MARISAIPRHGTTAVVRDRARFGLEVLRAVKAAVAGMPVVYRLSVEDFFPGGLRFEEGRRIAVWAARCWLAIISTAQKLDRSLSQLSLLLVK